MNWPHNTADAAWSWILSQDDEIRVKKGGEFPVYIDMTSRTKIIYYIFSVSINIQILKYTSHE